MSETKNPALRPETSEAPILPFEDHESFIGNNVSIIGTYKHESDRVKAALDRAPVRVDDIAVAVLGKDGTPGSIEDTDATTVIFNDTLSPAELAALRPYDAKAPQALSRKDEDSEALGYREQRRMGPRMSLRRRLGALASGAALAAPAPVYVGMSEGAGAFLSSEAAVAGPISAALLLIGYKVVKAQFAFDEAEKREKQIKALSERIKSPEHGALYVNNEKITVTTILEAGKNNEVFEIPSAGIRLGMGTVEENITRDSLPTEGYFNIGKKVRRGLNKAKEALEPHEEAVPATTITIQFGTLLKDSLIKAKGDKTAFWLNSLRPLALDVNNRIDAKAAANKAFADEQALVELTGMPSSQLETLREQSRLADEAVLDLARDIKLAVQKEIDAHEKASQEAAAAKALAERRERVSNVLGTIGSPELSNPEYSFTHGVDMIAEHVVDRLVVLDGDKEANAALIKEVGDYLNATAPFIKTTENARMAYEGLVKKFGDRLPLKSWMEVVAESQHK